MKIYLYSLLFLLVLLIVFLTSATLTMANETVKIRASVAKNRMVYINKKGEIQKITSNTLEDVKPKVVVIDKQVEQEIPLSDKILSDYYKLKVKLDFSSPGVVYDKTMTFKAVRDKFFPEEIILFLRKLVNLRKIVVAMI